MLFMPYEISAPYFAMRKSKQWGEYAWNNSQGSTKIAFALAQIDTVPAAKIALRELAGVDLSVPLLDDYEWEVFIGSKLVQVACVLKFFLWDIKKGRVVKAEVQNDNDSFEEPGVDF